MTTDTKISTSCKLGHSSIWKIDGELVGHCGNFKNQMCILLNGFCPQQGKKDYTIIEDNFIRDIVSGKTATNIVNSSPKEILPKIGFHKDYQMR